MIIIMPRDVAILRHLSEFIRFFCDVMEPNDCFIRVLIRNIQRLARQCRIESEAEFHSKRRANKYSCFCAGKVRHVSLIFWGITLAMLIAAVGVVVTPFRASHGRLTVALFAFVPAIAAAFYSGLGSPDAATTVHAFQSGSPAQSVSANTNVTRKPIGSVANMLDGLKSRLENEPDDAGGWLLLAKSYQHLGLTDEADSAYQKARALGKTDPVFEKSPANGVPVELIAPADSGPALRGQISLSLDAAALVQPGDAVFIFAKESAEHRMPVVAVRKPATELPIQFALTDRDAMIAGTSLAQFEQLVVTAKISRSGLATEVFEGLEVWSSPVSPLSNTPIELRLQTTSEAKKNIPGDSYE